MILSDSLMSVTNNKETEMKQGKYKDKKPRESFRVCWNT